MRELCNAWRDPFININGSTKYIKSKNLLLRDLDIKWISDTVLSNFRCQANLADTAANLVHNTKKLFNVKFYY